MIISLSRPYIKGQPIKVQTSFINCVVGFDISNSMFANDIYPNRFKFAKLKFNQLLNNFKNAQMGIIGFSSRAFLIAPMTNDYNSLKFLVSNLSFDYINLKGTSILNALQSANMLYKEDQKQKILILFTDGGDKDDLSKEIEYAKQNNISVFVYAIATKKGGVIKTKDDVLKDKDGNLVVTKINENIKKLALNSGGAYLPYSLKNNDIKALSDAIKSKFKAQKVKDEEILDNFELFFIPLALATLFFFISTFSLPRRIK
jgi:Ca-activated chloride channel family protein